LAEGLGDDGKVSVGLGSSTLELSVAGQVDCELEWRSTARRSSWTSS
jgi:hypothetical protein